jgi:hypothetical protein
MKIYVASSWRNEMQPEVVRVLREAGHEVYDFKHPGDEENRGFHWSDIDTDWKNWSPEAFRDSLKHPIAEEGFNRDFEAMERSDVFVLVMPCGRSAHLELGWAIGAGRKNIILLNGESEPELMYNMADYICLDVEEVVHLLEGDNYYPVHYVEYAAMKEARAHAEEKRRRETSKD